MEIELTEDAKQDLEFWRKSKNVKIQHRISELMNSIRQSPFEGIGKPEPLKHNLKGKWSRRIDHEHRLVYEITNGIIYILSMKGHY